MLSYKNYHAPHSLDEAMEIFRTQRRSHLLGGGAFMRMGNQNFSDIIDLKNLQLNTIEIQNDKVQIGAMASFWDLETSEVLPAILRNYFKKSLGQIVGVQLRNMVSVGGTVFSRYGFSDLNTALLGIGGTVHLHETGPISMDEFFCGSTPPRDILTHVKIPANPSYCTFESVRLSTADYALVNLAVCLINGFWRISVGARPGRAALAQNTMNFLNGLSQKERFEKDALDHATTLMEEELAFGTNRMGSASYRQLASKGLLKQALTEVSKHVASI